MNLECEAAKIILERSKAQLEPLDKQLDDAVQAAHEALRIEDKT